MPSETIETGNAMRYRELGSRPGGIFLQPEVGVYFLRLLRLAGFHRLGILQQHHVERAGGLRLSARSVQFRRHPRQATARLITLGLHVRPEPLRLDMESTTDYMGALAYGRKITGRLAFQVAAGPQEIISAGAGGNGNFHLLFASVNSALTYQRRRSGVSFNYVRGLSAGSGVFLGATSNTFSGSATLPVHALLDWFGQRRVCAEQQPGPCRRGHRRSSTTGSSARTWAGASGRTRRSISITARQARTAHHLPGGQLRRNWDLNKLSGCP